MTEQYKMGWTDPRTMSMEELCADYVATKAQVHKPWVGLTDEQIHNTAGYQETREMYSFARAIEDKLKEKNT